MTRGSACAFGLAIGSLLVPGALGGCRRANAETKADVRVQGEEVFRTVCARCHGLDGKGGIALGAANAPRNFCDHAFQLSRSDEELKRVIRTGKNGMPAFGSLFSDSELTGLVQKLRSFDPKGQSAH